MTHVIRNLSCLDISRRCGKHADRNQRSSRIRTSVVIGIRHLYLKRGRLTPRFGKLAGSMDWRTVSSSSSLLSSVLAYLLTLCSVVYAMVGCDLQDGTHIPPGSKVASDLKRIHFGAQIYPDPERCDLFR